MLKLARVPFYKRHHGDPEGNDLLQEQANGKVELEPRSLDSYLLSSVSMSSYSPGSRVCAYIWRGGWMTFQIPTSSVAGFSQDGTGVTLPSRRGKARARWAPAGRAGQLGQQPMWRCRHSSGPSHQLHNKVIMGLGIKLVTCVIILLGTRTEEAF